MSQFSIHNKFNGLFAELMTDIQALSSSMKRQRENDLAESKFLYDQMGGLNREFKKVQQTQTHASNRLDVCQAEIGEDDD